MRSAPRENLRECRRVRSGVFHDYFHETKQIRRGFGGFRAHQRLHAIGFWNIQKYVERFEEFRNG